MKTDEVEFLNAALDREIENVGDLVIEQERLYGRIRALADYLATEASMAQSAMERVVLNATAKRVLALLPPDSDEVVPDAP